MNPELKEKWVKALRSGEYKQTTGRMKRGDAYCCLGVLAEIAGLDPEDGAFLEMERLVGMYDTVCIRMNDDEGKTFPEIADYIEQNL